ncbi:hypothetical protein [Nocardia sp. CA-145437]|uniref:hypothetical protein n=1 Tax=Nocardia sp. CA-145437 TaxID=3239980 RepID=UPI003D986BF7
MTSGEPTRAPDSAGLTIATFCRVEGSADNAMAAARITSQLRQTGVPVNLIVRGVPQLMLERVQLFLSDAAAGPVDVRPYTTGIAEIMADLRDADVVVVPVRATEFDDAALAATVAGVPLLVPDISAIGLYLVDRYPADLTGTMLIHQQVGEPVPLDRWVAVLRQLYADMPATRHRAAELQRIVHQHNRIPEAVEASLAMIDQATRTARNLPAAHS